MQRVIESASLPWDTPDAWRETANVGAGGNRGIPQAYRFPDPDDPDVQRCLNCTLPEEACNVDPRCPFSARAKAKQKRVQDAARYIAERAVRRAVCAVQQAVEEAP